MKGPDCAAFIDGERTPLDATSCDGDWRETNDFRGCREAEEEALVGEGAPRMDTERDRDGWVGFAGLAERVEGFDDATDDGGPFVRSNPLPLLSVRWWPAVGLRAATDAFYRYISSCNVSIRGSTHCWRRLEL